MKKRVISLFIVVVLALSVSITAQAAPPGLQNFKIQKTYICGQFTDVSDAAWYAMAVQADYEYGLFSGRSASVFAPNDAITLAEAVKLAAVLNSTYETGSASFKKTTPWYKAYAEAAVRKRILDASATGYTAPVTRADFAVLIAKALPDAAFPVISRISDNAIPDVAVNDPNGPAVYKLYRAGILSGCDSFGTFHPEQLLSRAEAAAIVARAANSAFRKSITLPAPLSGDDLYQKCSPAVFYLERYDDAGDLLGIGSGFFISRSGLALTNYHVIEGAASAKITTSDGKTYDVKGLCGYDEVADLALLQIDGSGFPYLAPAASDDLPVGTVVYTIGSPYGLMNTISKGIVSNANQEIDGASYIQFSAPISIGSGGGPVLNTSGQVVGVACLTVLNGQTLNFAVPIHQLDAIQRTDCVPFDNGAGDSADETAYYAGLYPVPDFGVYADAPLYEISSDEDTGVVTFNYRQSDILMDNDTAAGYIDLLKQNGFVWQRTYTNDSGDAVDVYYNADFDISVQFGLTLLDGVVCRFVAVFY
ncbi:trypsin-like peptidase domain-containing protein [Oscillospiraceae bacterium CM]|nr:trypsin-like peptidase domain-containing protein [Oscillospiraceae bacterium CM]